MKRKLAAAIAIFLALGASGSAHRLDEYLQAAIISVEKDHVAVFMRMAPGVAVSSTVLANIDANADGVLSEAERQEYAQRVLRDLSLSVDGHRLAPRLLSVKFPSIGEMKEGLGEIQIEFSANLLPEATHRKFVLENHHEPRISAYLMNCLVPRDRDIRVIAQNRNQNQSFYELEYVQDGGRADALALSWWSHLRASAGNLGGFPSMFHLGIRHIAEGTDHLLFLLALLLPAPLLVARHGWSGVASVRQSLLRILKVVTAFTAGHSMTLALAAMSVVHVPSRPIEVLIAVSILVSAAHALRPLFPGREAVIAAFFGLIHGLAFAKTLGELGLDRWERLVGILAFNLGIETMQLVVVAATMPSLVLLSRTRSYPVLRIGGALFAGVAATGWIAERLLDIHTSVDFVINGVAQQAVWIAAALFLISLFCWSSSTLFPDRSGLTCHPTR